MMDFNDMDREELVELLESIRDTVKYAEDAGDAILSIAEELDLDLRVR